jgi:ABC-type antimicrobial peptide transport system permease subunit
MSGYKDDQIPAFQKRMIQAVESIPGVESVGLGDTVPLSDSSTQSIVYSDPTTELKPANAAATAGIYNITPEYLHASGTALLAGRTFTWHDDRSAPRVGVVNGIFARKMFGSVDKAIGGYYKMKDGTRIQVVGVAEDGKYGSLTEDPWPVMFLPILQSPSSSTWLVVRTKPGFGSGIGSDAGSSVSADPEQLASAIRSKIRELDPSLPLYFQTRFKSLDNVLFAPRVATVSLGVMGIMGATLAITGIFGMAAYSVSKRLKELGIRMALGAQRREVLRAALGRPLRLLAVGSAAGLILGLLATKVLAFIVYQATPRDPLVLAGVVLAMLVLGLIATWIPAQRALSVDPLILLRDD